KGTGGATFLSASERLRVGLRDNFAYHTQRHPGLKNSSNVYLCGGIVWAMMLHLYPEKVVDPNLTGMPLTPGDIERFYDLLKKQPGQMPAPDLSRVPPALMGPANA